MIPLVIKSQNFGKNIAHYQKAIETIIKYKRQPALDESLRSKATKYLEPSVLTKIYFYKKSELSDKNLELILSLGGDGTLIGVCRETYSTTPIFAVNMGHLGFITEFTKKSFNHYLDRYFRDGLPITRKTRFRVQKSNSEASYSFLNDLVISKNGIARIFKVNIFINKRKIYQLNGDGVIISSSIGSTAYNLAAGGPIIHPDVNSLTITPICPHSLTQKPLVISSKSELMLTVESSDNDLISTLDGQVSFDINKGDSININKKTDYNTLVENPDLSYYEKLKQKLNFS